MDPVEATAFPTVAVDLGIDGHRDLIMLFSTGLNSGPAREPVILINDGQGNLLDRTAEVIDGLVPEFFGPRDVLVKDFNGDGRPDIFFSNHGNEDPPGESGNWPCEQNRLMLLDTRRHVRLGCMKR